jgi:asparagine synthetase B (glutamine-hydrolysing)
MFDFYQIVDFKNKLRADDLKISFLSQKEYSDVKGFECTKRFKTSLAVYLERDNSDDNFFKSENEIIFIYGTVFSNNKYSVISGKKPHKLNSSDVFLLYKEYGDKLVKYIKGSFVLIYYNPEEIYVKMITDKLNVLPLYYYYRDGILIISSSVRMILSNYNIDKETDNHALTDLLFFDYIIGGKTFFKNVSQTLNASIYRFDKDKLSISEYWGVQNLYNQNLIGKSESLELLSTQLSENVDLYISDADKLLVSLTGGFDGRANLALLKRDPSSFLCYSYGMPGSKQITVPELISKKININYEPVYLDEKYEQVHDECTSNAVEFSNGTAPIMRSNYPYAYKRLRNYSNVILTGLFGSEVMRPLHNLGIMMNNYSEKMFLSKDPLKVLRDSLKELTLKNYLSENIVSESADYMAEELNSRYIKKYGDFDSVTRFFFFILNEGVRKYFMQEIQIERVYVTTRFPFFDDDFVELMYRTPYAGMYNGFLGKSKIKRRRGQLLYAYIYRRFKPELGKIELDRGYKPDDLLNPFPLNYFYLLQGVRKNNAYKKLKGNDSFDSVKWTKRYISDTLNNTIDKTGNFGNGLKGSFESGKYTGDLLKYSHLISAYKYINSF